MTMPNLEKMKAQLNAIKNPKSGSKREDGPYWKVEEGSHNVRLLPAGESLMKDFHWHYGINGKNYICAKNSFHKECPICELGTRLWKKHVDTGDDGLREMAKDLFSSKRFYFPVLVRGKEDEGAKIYSCGKRAAEAIMEIACDPDMEDMFDHKKGYDLKIVYKLNIPGDRRSAVTTISAARKPSPLFAKATEAQIEELFASVPDMDTLFELPDIDQIRADLDAYIGGLDTEATESLGTSSAGGATGEVLDAFNTLNAD